MAVVLAGDGEMRAGVEVEVVGCVSGEYFLF